MDGFSNKFRLKEDDDAKKWGMALLLLAIVVIMGSCRTPAGRTAGDVIDDSTITTKVKAKIFEDSIVKGMGISVDTFEGQVTLTGAVDTPQQKERAEELAKRLWCQEGE